MTQLQSVRLSRSQASLSNPRRVRRPRHRPSHASITSTTIWSATPGRKRLGPGKLVGRPGLSARLAVGEELEDKVEGRDRVLVRELRPKPRHARRNL